MTENDLRGVYYAERDMRRLLCDLQKLEQRYEEEYTNDHRKKSEVISQKTKVKRSPVEEKVIVLVDHFSAEVDSAKRELAGRRALIESIKQAVLRAGLSPREQEYVRLRYYESRSVEALERIMSYTKTDRIRRSVLEKLEGIKI